MEGTAGAVDEDRKEQMDKTRKPEIGQSGNR